MSKFTDVPVEKDTHIIAQIEAVLGQYDILYQKWSWDGIVAESIIFANDDVQSLDEVAILAEVSSSPLVEKDSKITYKQSDSGYTFVNFKADEE